MNTHGKKLFTGIEHVKGFFLFDVAPVHEIEHPFRSCNHALYIHCWPGKAVVLGWWKKRHNETENLMKAVGGRVVQEKEISRPGLVSTQLRQNKIKTSTDEFS